MLCFLFDFLRKDEVEDDGQQEYHGHAVFSKDGLHNLRENGKEARSLGEAEANAERETDDDHIALGEARLGHHAETGEENAAKHHDGATAENGLRDGGENGAHDGKQTAKDHDEDSRGDDEAVDDLGYSRQSDVLGEGGDGGATEKASQGAEESITGHRTTHLLLLHFAAEGSRAKGRGVADGLCSRDEEDADDGQNGIEMELGLEGHKAWKGHHFHMAQTAKIDHTHTDRENVAHGQSYQDGERTEEASGKDLSEEAGEERHGSYDPVGGATKVGCALPSRETIGSDGEKGETDGRHNRGCHNLGDEPGPVFWKQSKAAFHQAANDDGSHQRAHTLGSGDSDGQREEGKTDTHHDRQARSDTPHGIELDESTDTGYDHTVLDKCGAQLGIHTSHIGQDDDRGDIGDKHRQDVLQSEGNGLEYGHAAVEFINRSHIVSDCLKVRGQQRLLLLTAKMDGLCLPIHALDDGDGLDLVALLAEHSTTLLLAFLDGNAYAGYLASRLLHQVDEGMGSLAVGQEIVHNQHLVGGVEIGLGDEDIVELLMGEGIGVRDVFVIGTIGRLTLLRKDHRYVVEVAQERSNGNAAGLDGQDLVDFHPAEPALELVGHLAHDVYVYLMVQKTIDLEDIALFDDSRCEDLFF